MCWRIPLIALFFCFVCCTLCPASTGPRLTYDPASRKPRLALPSLERIFDLVENAALPLYLGVGGQVLPLDPSLSCQRDFRLLGSPSLRGRPLGLGLSVALNDDGAYGVFEVASGLSRFSSSSLPLCGSVGLRLPF